MMPLAPQLSIPHLGQISSLNMKAASTVSKPKLSFSIDSIVGGKRKALESGALDSESLSEAEMIAKSLKRHLTDTPTSDGHCSGAASPISAGHRSPQPIDRQSVSPLSVKSLTPNGLLKAESEISPAARGTPSPNSFAAAAAAHAASFAGMNPLTSNGVPSPFLNRSPLGLAPGHPLAGLAPGHLPSVNPMAHPNHQQMMMAAAAAAAASSGHAQNGAPGFPPSHMDYQQAAAFYPWFLRANPFAGRFPGMPFDSPLGSFLLPPFRKPKRIRTAFSPGQLLKLEQAFEKNHYVVGNERKQLANHLGLSETQVKVWFQNRRTKHKRQKQEDEEGTGSNGGNENGSHNKNYSDEEEEEIDLEDDDDGSNSDHEMLGAAEAMKMHANGLAQNGAAGLLDPNQAAAAAAALKFNNMHLWYQSMMMQQQQQQQQQQQSQAKSPQPPTSSPL